MNPQIPGSEKFLADRIEELERRLAIQQRILDDRLLRLENNRILEIWKNFNATISDWLAPSRDKATRRAIAGQYRIWLAHEQAALPAPERALDAVQTWKSRPVISIEPTTDCGNQIYPYVERNATAGDYVCFVSKDYCLSPWASYYIAEVAQRTGCDLIYADEDRSENGRRCDPVFTPDWSPRLLESCMYFGAMFAVRRELLNGTDFARSNRTRPDLHELALQLAGSVTHAVRVPRVLSHFRTGVRWQPATSTSAMEAYANAHGAITVPGLMTGASVMRPRVMPGLADVIVCSKNPALVASCLDSIRATAPDQIGEVVVVAHEEKGPNESLRAAARNRGATVIPYTGAFNFAAMNNDGAATAKNRYLLFLNDDVIAKENGWLQAMLYQISCRQTGIAGAVLWYPSGYLQHAGIAVGIGEAVGHIGRGTRRSDIWPWLLATRNVSAVTGACLAIRTELFRELGGFDPGYPNNYNDVDLCFRVRERGYDVVCVAAPGLVHAECQTRRGLVRFEERYRLYKRWGRTIERLDPFYSPILTPTEQIAIDLSIGQPPDGQHV